MKRLKIYPKTFIGLMLFIVLVTRGLLPCPTPPHASGRRVCTHCRIQLNFPPDSKNQGYSKRLL